MAYNDIPPTKGMTVRKIEKIRIEPCGCYVQLITEDWMGELVTYENPVICSSSDHW